MGVPMLKFPETFCQALRFILWAKDSRQAGCRGTEELSLGCTTAHLSELVSLSVSSKLAQEGESEDLSFGKASP